MCIRVVAQGGFWFQCAVLSRPCVVGGVVIQTHALRNSPCGALKDVSEGKRWEVVGPYLPIPASSSIKPAVVCRQILQIGHQYSFVDDNNA